MVKSQIFPKSDIFSFPYHVTHYVQWTPAITSLTSTPISFIHIWPHLSIRRETASLLKMKKCHISSVLNNISKFTTTVSLQQHLTVLNNNNIAILNNITTWQNLISPQIQDMKNQSWKTSLEKSWIKTNNPQKIQDVQMPTQTHSHYLFIICYIVLNFKLTFIIYLFPLSCRISLTIQANLTRRIFPDIVTSGSIWFMNSPFSKMFFENHLSKSTEKQLVTSKIIKTS